MLKLKNEQCLQFVNAMRFFVYFIQKSFKFESMNDAPYSFTYNCIS